MSIQRFGRGDMALLFAGLVLLACWGVVAWIDRDIERECTKAGFNPEFVRLSGGIYCATRAGHYQRLR